MFQIEIDDQQCNAEAGETILTVARRHGIAIPTLCHHDGLEPAGACRICVVEVTQRGRTRLESACTRPAEEGLVVHTNTDDICQHRRMIAELLLARCPKSERIQELAREVGVTDTRFDPLDKECVLCGLCVRACQDAIGTSAISFTNRGIDRQVTTPFAINSEVCIGCGACARVCPTGAITVEDVGDTRYLRYFNTELPLAQCSECGSRYTTQRRAELTSQEPHVPDEFRTLCPDCRRKRQAAALRRYVN